MLYTSGFVMEKNTTDYDSAGFVQVNEMMIFCPLTILFSLLGLVGNGKVIWFLVFCSESNPFTTYILNLAVADFGTLLTLSARAIILVLPQDDLVGHSVYILAYLTYSTSVYFLTIISLERCLSVLFPIWYRCHRPEQSSAVVSLLLWSISSLLSGTLLFFSDYMSFEDYLRVLKAIFTLNLLIFSPIMVASTLIMSIKLCCGTRRRQPPRLYIAILVTLLFFIVFAIPLSTSCFMLVTTGEISFSTFQSSFLFASFNSSINPVIYYFVGRNRKKCRESLRVVFKRVFMDEVVSPDGTQLENTGEGTIP